MEVQGEIAVSSKTALGEQYLGYGLRKLLPEESGRENISDRGDSVFKVYK